MGQTTCHAHDSVDLYDHAHLAEVGVFAKVVIQWFVRFSLGALEYGFGMYVGAIVGWILGYFSGGVYAELFEPVYFADFSNMEEVMRWDQMSYAFARIGIWIGAVIGALIVLLMPRETLEFSDDNAETRQRDGQMTAPSCESQSPRDGKARSTRSEQSGSNVNIA